MYVHKGSEKKVEMFQKLVWKEFFMLLLFGCYLKNLHYFSFALERCAYLLLYMIKRYFRIMNEIFRV